MSSSNDIVVSQEEDERLAKELSLKEAAAHDLSHRPKRRRFHESYNFNMKCPTPGCNSLGEWQTDTYFTASLPLQSISSSSSHSTPSTSSFGLSQVISQGGTRDISPYQDALSTTTFLPMNARYTHTQTQINMTIHQRGIQDKKWVWNYDATCCDVPAAGSVVRFWWQTVLMFCQGKASTRDKQAEERTLSHRQDENRHSTRNQVTRGRHARK